MPGGGVKYSADAGCHDDLVMSLAISLWMVLENADVSAPINVNSGQTVSVDLRKMREERSKLIAQAESDQAEAWNNFVYGGSGLEF
jgi:hypothetical protein